MANVALTPSRLPLVTLPHKNDLPGELHTALPSVLPGHVHFCSGLQRDLGEPGGKLLLNTNIFQWLLRRKCLAVLQINCLHFDFYSQVTFQPRVFNSHQEQRLYHSYSVRRRWAQNGRKAVWQQQTGCPMVRKEELTMERERERERWFGELTSYCRGFFFLFCRVFKGQVFSNMFDFQNR